MPSHAHGTPSGTMRPVGVVNALVDPLTAVVIGEV